MRQILYSKGPIPHEGSVLLRAAGRYAYSWLRKHYLFCRDCLERERRSIYSRCLPYFPGDTLFRFNYRRPVWPTPECDQFATRSPHAERLLETPRTASAARMCAPLHSLRVEHYMWRQKMIQMTDISELAYSMPCRYGAHDPFMSE